MGIKLICIDMDGTLLDDNHTISNENKQALKVAVEKGIHVAITTGRLFTSAKYYASLIGINGPLICSNGAYIKDMNTGEVIYNNTLSVDETHELYDILSRYNITTYFNTFNSVISSDAFPESYPYLKTNKTLGDEFKVNLIVENNIKPYLESRKGQILKGISFSVGKSREDLLKAKAELINLNKYEVVISGPENFEFMKKGSSKGNAVKILSEMLGIKQEEVMCIGDSENDLSMIKFAGVGVAMGNALDILKENADYITDTNINSGVGKAILKYIN